MTCSSCTPVPNRNYLSFGGGVNSVALYLHLMDLGMSPGDPASGFEAVFVDHGGDWPETYRYVEAFRERFPVTVLKTKNIHEHFLGRKCVAARINRECTDKFKIRPFYKYASGPGFVFKGIDAGESRRASIHTHKGLEARYPLVEAEIDRQGCIDLIRAHGLQVPPKSGCFFCPFQPSREFRRLRREEPCLFAKAVELEQAATARRAENGKGPIWIKDRPLSALVAEDQHVLIPELDYPPCECGL